MSIFLLAFILLALILLGYPYFLLVIAGRERGATRVIGQAISSVFALVLVLLILLSGSGVARMPRLRFMSERPTTRMMKGMAGYFTGMMLEDEKGMDEFIKSLRANPELYDRFKQKLK